MADTEKKKIQFLDPGITSITIAKGEEFVLEPEMFGGLSIDNLEISSSQPEEVRVRSNRIVGIRKGTATLTVSYDQIQSGERLRRQAKIKINVVEPTSYVGSFAKLMLPIHIRDAHREWLNGELGIVTCHQLLDYVRQNGMQTLILGTRDSVPAEPVDEFAVRIWLRQSALFQVEGMTSDFAFLAAVAGIRNASDLARVSQSKLLSAFRSLEPSAAAFLEGKLKAPEYTQIAAVLAATRSMIISSNEFNSIVFDGDQEPTYLLDSNSGIRTDSEILNEGLQFLQNITVALPLPRTITGRLLMKNQNSEEMAPVPGCKVQISGIANPAEDRVQDDEDLFSYTDYDGFFTILMPERYNMQECITLTVTENQAMKAKNILTLQQAADAVNTMTFLRRASEIMDTEYIWVRNPDQSLSEINRAEEPRYRMAGKDARDVWKPAGDVLRDFDRLQYLNTRNMELESRMKASVNLKHRETLQLLKMQNSLLVYRTQIDELIAELEKHKTEKEDQVKGWTKTLNSVRTELTQELYYHRMADIRALELRAEELRKELDKWDNRTPDEQGYSYEQHHYANILADYGKVSEALNVLKKDTFTVDGGIRMPIRHDHIVSGESGLIPLKKMTEAEEALFLGALKHYKDQLPECVNFRDLLLKHESVQESLAFVRSEVTELERVIGILRQERDAIILPEIDQKELADALGSDTDYVIDPPKLQDYGVVFSDTIESSLRKIRDAVYNCDEFFACYEKYQKGRSVLESDWAALEDFRQQSISQTAAKNFEEYLKSFQVYQDEDKTQPLTKSHRTFNGIAEFTVDVYSDETVQEYMDNLAECRFILQNIYDLDASTNDIRQTMLNFLAQPMDAYLGDMILVESAFRVIGEKQRALPSVRLMGEGEDAVYLPTDTAPSRIFNYSMLQRLVDPTISKGDKPVTRTALNKAINVMDFRLNMRENQREVPMATSLGMGYMLNMHQAWVPDGFALGSLLYSLVLAPGEEQRIIVQEHKESLTVVDEADATDTVNDTYSNSQQDSETAAFTQAAQRYSAASSNYDYQSEAKSSGKSGISFFFGLGASSKASSSNSGSGSSNASQKDSYDEASTAAQNFQTEIKTESARLATAKRTSIRTASSSETESVSSKIIANHNHSHVMTVQYWEVNRRYRMETCISGIDLVLFVPMQMIQFLPDAGSTPSSDLKRFAAYMPDLNDFKSFTSKAFAYRYGNVLSYADILMSAIPYTYRGGLKLMQKFASVPEWKLVTKASEESVVTVTLKGHFLETDRLSARLYFQGSSISVEGEVEHNIGHKIPEFANTRKRVLSELRDLRSGGGNKPEQEVKITFYLPSGLSRNDIAYMTVQNDLSPYQVELSQKKDYLTDDEKDTVEKYNSWKYALDRDNWNSLMESRMDEYYRRDLPECYRNPVVTLDRNDLLSLGKCRFSVTVDDTNDIPVFGTLGGSPARVYLENRIPVMGYKEISEMERTLHHICSDTIGYSQVIWGSLSDDERIMMLEPYTVEMKFDKVLSGENYMSDKPISVSLLSCVNAKKLIGFYGNCMLLPFTYPKQLAEVLGKSAAEVQDELYRFHTTNFRVPTTVISVPTDGMVGEAVLGATNVSEKIDITRFWNWKDSEIDHMNIDQSSFNQHSLLDNAETMQVNVPTQGVQATSHIDGNGLLAALLQRSQPTFADVLGNTDIRDLLKNADNNASSGREQIVKSNSETLKATIEAAAQVATAYLTGKAAKKEQENQDSGKDGDKDDEVSPPAEPTQPVTPEPGQPSQPGGIGEDEPVQPPQSEPDQPSKPEPDQPSKPEPVQPSKPEPDQPSKPKPSQPSQPKPDVSNNDSDEQLSGGYCSNLADEAFRDISNGVSGNEWVNSIFDPIEGNEMTFTEEDIERIARAVCLDNGTSLDKVAEEIYLALMSQMEGE